MQFKRVGVQQLVQVGMCIQRRLRTASKIMQSNQSLWWELYHLGSRIPGKGRILLFTARKLRLRSDCGNAQTDLNLHCYARAKHAQIQKVLQRESNFENNIFFRERRNGERIQTKTTISGPSSTHQWNSVWMAFCWRVDNGPKLHAGLVALWFFRGSGPVLLRKFETLYFVIFQGSGHPVPPLYPPMPSVPYAGYWLI